MVIVDPVTRKESGVFYYSEIILHHRNPAMKRIEVLLFLCLLTLPLFIKVNLAGANPFDVRGYRQGMSLEEVKRLAEKQGYTLHHDKGSEWLFTVKQGEKEILNLSICNDRVFSAFYTVSGGFERFVKQLDSLIKQGLQKTDVSWRSSLDYNGKEYYDMSIYFTPPGPKNEYYVTAALFASEEYGTTNSQITWTAVTGYCK
jgi:hypothetical protein